MFLVDDPMLALIVRFVAGDREFGVSDEELQQRQIRAIREYVSRFPEQERQVRALEWIEANAERYRRQWQRAMVAECLSDTRCPDCPLMRDDTGAPCEIHDRWKEALDRYLEDEISAGQYVESTLALLEAHKNRLKVAHSGGKP